MIFSALKQTWSHLFLSCLIYQRPMGMCVCVCLCLHVCLLQLLINEMGVRMLNRSSSRRRLSWCFEHSGAPVMVLSGARMQKLAQTGRYVISELAAD